jgi:predicted nucleic acid-binding protein
MYLLDTNVISELTKPSPSAGVLGWFASTPTQYIYISSVTLCELQLGLALLPVGKRRQALIVATEALVQEDFAQRCLSLDARCAPFYGQIAAKRQQQGKPSSAEDAMIAAIALVYQFTLVTRNIKDFEGVDGLMLLTPF